VKLEVDRVEGAIRPRIWEEERASPYDFTTISVQFPWSGQADGEGLDGYARDTLDLVAATSMVNPGRRIDYSIFGRKGVFGDRSSEEK
jgi:hypothetical protein